jgi:hypothetical protein
MLLSSGSRVVPASSLARNHQVHLIQKLTLARALGHKFESGCGKADLFHLNLTHEALNWVTFADPP